MWAFINRDDVKKAFPYERKAGGADRISQLAAKSIKRN